MRFKLFADSAEVSRLPLHSPIVAFRSAKGRRDASCQSGGCEARQPALSRSERRRSAATHRARGFTLPELLVATACSLVIMAIIAYCFQGAIDAFRKFRAIASMQDKLKSAENVIKRDLASEHFSGIFRPGYGGPFLRDQRLDLTGWYPPDEGYFYISTVFGNVEGTDSDGLPSFQSGPGSALQFTVKLSGKRDEDYCRGVTPNALVSCNPPDFNPTPPAGQGYQLVSRWAEVGYFLAAPPNQTQPTANGQPLWNLYRRQRVALSTETIATVNPVRVGYQNSISFYPDISISPSGTVNSSADLTVAGNRMALSPITGTYLGDDILLTNVISFDVSLNWSNGNAAGNAPAFSNYGPSATTDWPFPQATMTFDTGSRTTNSTINWDDPTSYPSATGIPSRIRVNAIQIRIRIWDSSTQTARQLTIVQDV